MWERFSKTIFSALLVFLLACLFAAPAMADEIPAAGGTLVSGTYTLTEDLTVSSQITIASGETVTLDLNGSKLNIESSTLTQLLKNQGTLTIKDSSAAGTGELNLICSKSSSILYVLYNYGGTLNLESGTINIKRTAGTSTVYGIYSGTINMTGGNLNVVATSQVSTVNGISSGGVISGGQVTVSTAKSSGTANVVSNSLTTISGGTFNGKTISATVTGGTFNFDPSSKVPPYKYTVTETSGSWTVSENADAEKRIDVDGTEYVNFHDVTAAIEGKTTPVTVKLLKEYDTSTMPFTIPAGTNVTLDLNGTTLKGSGAQLMKVSGSLTIKDSGASGKIEHTYSGTSKMYTIYGTSPQITLESGTIQTKYAGTTSSVYVYGIYNDEVDSTITLNGGSITVTSTQSNTYGVKSNSGKLIMNDGTVDVTAAKSVYGLGFSSGSEMTGGTVTATSKTSTAYGITGTGTISHGTVHAIAETAGKTANVVSTSTSLITGGTFNGTTVSAEVRGGTFYFDPAAVNANIPAFTYKVIQGTDAAGKTTWTVSEVPESELPKNIDVNGQEFATFELAEDAIVTGSTVKLLQDYDGGKTAISLPAGVTFDLNGKTLTLDKSVTLSFVGGTESQPTLITDKQATSHENAGTIKALMQVGSGYTNFEKVNVNTTETEKRSTFEITGTPTNKAYVNLSGLNISTAATDTGNAKGDFTSTHANITINDLNPDFGFEMYSHYAASSTSYYHTIFHNDGYATITIQSGKFNLTEGGANHKVYFAYNDASTSLIHIEGGEFYFLNSEKQVTDVSLLWTRYGAGTVTGGKFYTENTAVDTFGTSGYSSNPPPTIISGGLFNVPPRATSLVAGYEVIENPDTTTNTIYPYTVKFDYGAKVGSNEYVDIQEALDEMAAGNETGREIVLLKNATPGSALVVKVDGVTITKGDYTLTLPEDNAAVRVYNTATMPNGIDVEFEAYRDLTAAKDYYTSFAVAAVDPGNITLLKDITLGDTKSFRYNTGDVTLNLGNYTITSSYSGSGEPALFTILSSAMGPNTLTINAETGGIVTNNCYTFHVGMADNHNFLSRLVINGGNFYGATTCVNVQKGEVIINGGSFKSSSTGFTINCIDESYRNGLAKVSISGGSFYEFDPGNNAAEGQETSYLVPGYTTTYDETTNLYTVDVKSITISFNTDGGTAIDSITQDFNTEVTAPTVPTKEGHTFAGWTPAFPETMPAEDTTYKALWNINQYTITFDTEDGTAIPPITQDFNTEVTAPADPTRIGYVFNRWNTTIPEFMPAYDQTIRALWDANTTSITFDSAGGSEVAKIEEKVGTTITAPTAPTLLGYTFMGWTPAFPDTMPVENITLTAVWEIAQYTITFDTDGGDPIEPITQDYNSPVMAPANPTKAGSTFLNWNTTIPALMPAYDLTIKALWDANTTSITFNSAGGSEVATINGKAGSTVEAPADPTMTGYTFTGWDPAFPGIMPVENITLTATWSINQYTITFDTDGGSPIDPITQDYNTPVTSPAPPAKEGSIFSGWNTTIPALMPAYDLTIKALWDADTSTITFDSAGGSEVAPITGEVGSGITAPTAPTKDGYTFAGWNPAFPDTMPVDDLTLTAVWEIAQYTITFDTDGGSAIAPITQNYSTAVTAPEEPTKEGYIFAGWNTTIPTLMPAHNMVIKALWDANPTISVITFDSAGGSEVAPISGEVGTPVTAPGDPTKEGYTFAGWNPAFPETIPTESITLTAAWNINQYTITFDTDGGSAIAPITQNYSTAVTAPADPTKEGSTFAGWNTTIPTQMPAYNHTIKALWDTTSPVLTSTITFDSNGGSAVAPLTGEVGSSITAPAAPTKEGHTFAGWEPEFPETMLDENITLTATWNINQYTITFDTDGGSAIAPITQDYNTTVTAPADPTKEGSTFAGWNTTIPTQMPAYNLTIKALWDTTAPVLTSTVTFDSAGGSAVAPITGEVGASITAPADPTKEGYTFAGWEPALPETMPDENITLTATWNINKYTITFDTDGGSAIAPITQDYNTAVTAPADPTKEGSTFAGWNTTIPTQMPAYNLTIKALWDTVTYTITWYHNGTLLETDENVPHGTLPTYNGLIPTKEANTTHTFSFKGWTPEVSPAKIDRSYIAQFIAIEIPAPETPIEPVNPVVPSVPVQVTTNETDGNTTIIAPNIDKPIEVSEDKKEAKFEDTNGGVTVLVTFQEPANTNADNTGTATAVSGNVAAVDITYKESPASTTEETGEVTFQLDLSLKNFTTNLPKVDANIQQDIVNELNKEKPAHQPATMVTADSAINEHLKETEESIRITFIVDKAWADTHKDKIYWFHHDGQNLLVFEKVQDSEIHPHPSDETKLLIIITGSKFSTYGLAVEKTDTSSGSPGYSGGGSSVWVTPTPTPTETPLPSETPTEIVPTDIPTTQPTETETPASPLSLVGVLAGLGAVAVLRRK